MESGTTTGEGGATSHAPYGDLVAAEGAEAALANDVNLQDQEGLRVLFLGFGTGMTIALVFLVYVMLEHARLLP